jgi:hypothetical protein
VLGGEQRGDQREDDRADVPRQDDPGVKRLARGQSQADGEGDGDRDE